MTLSPQAEVSEHSSKVDRARHMEKKMGESFRKRVQATSGVVTAEEEDIKLQGFKESVNELLAAVLSTVEDNPELKGKVCSPPCSNSAPVDIPPHGRKCALALVLNARSRCWTLWARPALQRRRARSAPTSARTAAMPAASSLQDLKALIEVVSTIFLALHPLSAMSLQLQAARATERTALAGDRCPAPRADVAM